jgi:ATP-dependent exoDNAse (exonuclease V) alpha subunit
LDPSQGLCNGSHGIVINVTTHVLEIRLIGGEHEGKMFFIPHISLTPSDMNLPFQLKHHQFPVCLAFCMTINKSQGQFVQNVGLHLHTPVFTHGQLYVALSCCTSNCRIKVLLQEEHVEYKTQNVVYSEVLLQ